MIDLKKHTNDFLMLPLGGVEEIGMNSTLYHYKGKWIMVDLGIGFADDYMPGINVIVPNLEFIIERRKDLLGIILTHAHEDHCGAIPYLWKELKCPIYATPFTAQFLKSKIENFNIKNIKIHTIKQGSKFNIEPFKLELIALTHSIVEMQGIVLTAGDKKIFHSGDWKFDENPLIGQKSNIKRLQELGKENITAMVCDSTNIMNPGVSGSEGDIQNNLYKIITNTKQLIIFTLFASNIARIYSISSSAQKLNKKIIVFGKSLWRIITIAQECGYLKDIEFYNEKQIGDTPRNKLVFLCTGCQGEQMATMSKLATKHNSINYHLQPGDTVVFASKIVPGNEKKVSRIINMFASRDINIIAEYNARVHVSGHANYEELKQMYEMIKPKVSLPVHGESLHIQEHLKAAKKWGVKHSLKITNGDIIKIEQDNVLKIGSTTCGYFGISPQLSLLQPEGIVMNTRRDLRQSGIIIAIITIKPDMSLLKKPTVITPGFLDYKQDINIINNIIKTIEKSFFNNINVKDINSAKKIIKSKIKSICKIQTNQQPYIHVQIELVH